MASLAGFLEQLFVEGRVVFEAPPVPAEAAAERFEAAELLRRAFEDDLMELAGPPIEFDEASALAAAEWTRRACWFLVSRGEPPEVVDRALELPAPAGSAAEHLAADLTFRYLPGVYRRAGAIDPGDLLTTRLAELLQFWPFSGVIASLPGGPKAPLDFGGHEGLQLRYAERWADQQAMAWRPPDGPGREVLALVLDAIGQRDTLRKAAGDSTEARSSGRSRIGGTAVGRD